MSIEKEALVPIKRILHTAIKKNNCKYEKRAINLFRGYIIASLNLGFIDMRDIEALVCRFTSAVKEIEFIFNESVDTLNGSYIITCDKILILACKESSERAISFFKAITEVLFSSKNSEDGVAFRTAITEMVVEKIEDMQINYSNVITPTKDNEILVIDNLAIRTEYQKHNLLITLLKQFFVLMDFNENLVINKAFYGGIDEVYKSATKEEDAKLLMDALDLIYNLYVDRVENEKYTPNEVKLIESYQLFINSLFKDIDHSYIAFAALITNEKLCKKCMLYKINNKEQEM